MEFTPVILQLNSVRIYEHTAINDVFLAACRFIESQTSKFDRVLCEAQIDLPATFTGTFEQLSNLIIECIYKVRPPAWMLNVTSHTATDNVGDY